MAKSNKVTDVAVPGILVLSFIVYYIWNWTPGADAFFNQHFIASRTAIGHFRLWTVLTSSFAHLSSVHLLVSSILLVTIGWKLEDLIGSKWFFEYFLVSGCIGAMNHCMVSSLVHQPNAPLYGATGALTGVVTLAACIFRQKTIWFFKVIPVKVPIVAGLLLVADLLGIFILNEDGAPIGYGSHIAAAAVALVYYHKVLRYRVWRNLKSAGEGQPLMPVKITGQAGWIIPCHHEDTFADMGVFMREVLGLSVLREGEPDSDDNIKKFARFSLPNGWVELIEVNRNARDLFSIPIMAITVDNLANACRNMDSRNLKMVAPVYHSEENWAIVYFSAPDGRTYQIQGPYPNA